MKYWIYILIFLLPIATGTAQDAPNDAAPESSIYPVLPTESHTPAPVGLNENTVKSYADSKEYDYYTFRPKEENWLQQILNTIIRWLFRSADKTITSQQTNIAGWIIVGIAAVLLIVAFLIFKPSLFYRTPKKNRINYQVENESIHDLSFDRLIRNALARNDYSEAIRWKYLSVLKALQDKGLISWEIHKTVNEYAREFKRTDLQQEFRNLSSEFLYVRYGHFEASAEEYADVETWSNTIIKRI